MQKLKISILIDNPKSWFVPYGQELGAELIARGHEVSFVENPQDLPEGDVAFFLSCEQIIKKDLRDRNTHNIVIHSSKLPQGKGWSPLTWQILEGKNTIPTTLFEAVDAVDAGDVYEVDNIILEGHELLPEIHKKQGEIINSLALRFVDSYPPQNPQVQKGEESFYPKRKPKDSEVSPDKTLAEIFDNFRVADNEKYPVFFTHRGKTYTLKIYKKEE